MKVNEAQIVADELQAQVQMLQSRCIRLAVEIARLRAEREASQASPEPGERRTGLGTGLGEAS